MAAAAVKAGDRVLLGSDQLKGLVRFAGTTHFAPGEWLGIELDEPNGKNDGCVKGERYFPCKPQHGIFVRPNMVKVVDGADAPSGDAPRRSAVSRPSSVSKVGAATRHSADHAPPQHAAPAQASAPEPRPSQVQVPALKLASEPAPAKAAPQAPASPEAPQAPQAPQPPARASLAPGPDGPARAASKPRASLQQPRPAAAAQPGPPEPAPRKPPELGPQAGEAPARPSRASSKVGSAIPIDDASDYEGDTPASHKKQSLLDLHAADWSSLSGHAAEGPTSEGPSPKAAAAAQLELATAVEDHDVEKIRSALPVAASLGVPHKELDTAQRVMRFELGQLMIRELEGVRAVVAQLNESVRAAEERAKEAERCAAATASLLAAKRAEEPAPVEAAKPAPAEAPRPERHARLVEDAEGLERRFWERLEGHLEEHIGAAVARATRELAASTGEAQREREGRHFEERRRPVRFAVALALRGAAQRLQSAPYLYAAPRAYGKASQRWRLAVKRAFLLRMATSAWCIGRGVKFAAEKVVGPLEAGLAVDDEFDSVMRRMGQRRTMKSPVQVRDRPEDSREHLGEAAAAEHGAVRAPGAGAGAAFTRTRTAALPAPDFQGEKAACRDDLPGEASPAKALSEAPSPAPFKPPGSPPGKAPPSRSKTVPLARERSDSAASGKAPFKPPGSPPGKAPPSRSKTVPLGKAQSDSTAPGTPPRKAVHMSPGKAPFKPPGSPPGKAPPPGRGKTVSFAEALSDSTSPGNAPSKAPGKAPFKPPGSPPGKAPPSRSKTVPLTRVQFDSAALGTAPGVAPGTAASKAPFKPPGSPPGKAPPSRSKTVPLAKAQSDSSSPGTACGKSPFKPPGSPPGKAPPSRSKTVPLAKAQSDSSSPGTERGKSPFKPPGSPPGKAPPSRSKTVPLGKVQAAVGGGVGAGEDLLASKKRVEQAEADAMSAIRDIEASRQRMESALLETEEKVTQATTKIQAASRGRQTRKSLAAKGASEVSAAGGAEAGGAEAEAPAAGADLLASKRRTEVAEAEAMSALQDIEASRRRMESALLETEEKVTQATTKIQAVARGKQARKELELQHEKAKVLQKGFRGHLERKKTKGSGPAGKSEDAVSAEVRERQERWAGIFEEAAKSKEGPPTPDQSPSAGALGREAFLAAICKAHPSVSPRQSEALWAGFAGGTGSASMDLPAFCEIAEALALGSHAAAEFADRSEEAFEALGAEAPPAGPRPSNGAAAPLAGPRPSVGSGSEAPPAGPRPSVGSGSEAPLAGPRPSVRAEAPPAGFHHSNAQAFT